MSSQQIQESWESLGLFSGAARTDLVSWLRTEQGLLLHLKSCGTAGTAMRLCSSSGWKDWRLGCLVAKAGMCSCKTDCQHSCHRFGSVRIASSATSPDTSSSVPSWQICYSELVWFSFISEVCAVKSCKFHFLSGQSVLLVQSFQAWVSFLDLCWATTG